MLTRLTVNGFKPNSNGACVTCTLQGTGSKAATSQSPERPQMFGKGW